MKNLIKKICKCTLVFVAMILCANNVYAWYIPSNNRTSLSVGASYSDGVSSTNNANDAYSTYNAMGLTSKKITSTTTTNITGSHSNGTPYLQSGIVYLNGHANSSLMEFSNSISLIVLFIIVANVFGISSALCHPIYVVKSA